MLNGEKAEVYEKDLSLSFETIAGNLIESPFWFDGLIGLNAIVRKSRQIVFEGKMWTAKDVGNQWLEPFRATVTDKRITKQGIWVKIQVGEYFGEGELFETLG